MTMGSNLSRAMSCSRLPATHRETLSDIKMHVGVPFGTGCDVAKAHALVLTAASETLRQTFGPLSANYGL